VLGLTPGVHEGHDVGRLPRRTSHPRPLGVAAGDTDGAPGLIGAVEVVFSQSLRQRCLVHCARNLLAKVPTHPAPGVGGVLADFDDITADPDQLAVDEARRRAEAFADR
jgi:transposase-like protein